MGKSKARKPSKVKLTQKSPKSDLKRIDDPGYVEKLLENANGAIDTFQYELALQFCERAVEHQPENTKALELLASVQLELGDMEQAKMNLLKAIELQPEIGHEKYLSLGQLSDGSESLEYYQKGIDIIQKELETKHLFSSEAGAEAMGQEVKDLIQHMSTSYCAMVETYMTDCCNEDQAESECDRLTQCAIEVAPDNPEAYQSRANYLLVKEELEEARINMKKSLSLWLPKYQAMREERFDASSNVTLDEACYLSYDCRLNTSKLLIELEMYDESTEVLEGLLEEDDEVVETWYLLGWLNYLRKNEYLGNARFYLTKAKKIGLKLQTIEGEMLGHIDELLSELGGPQESDEDDDEENGENGKNDEEDFETESEEEMNQEES